MIKELRSIRADPTMLVLVAYAFSISVNTVAKGAVTEATNLSVGIVDEDGSELSRQIAEALVPPTFQRAVQIRATDIDSVMDKGNLLFVVEIPPNFQADIRALQNPRSRSISMRRRWPKPEMALAISRTAISNEVRKLHFRPRRREEPARSIVVIRAKFNPNLKTAWFSAMTQVINQITLLTVILTGAALIREREQGTVEHLLGHARSAHGDHARENVWPMASSFLLPRCFRSNFVVEWWLGVPITGSLFLFTFRSRRFTPSRSRRSASCSARSRPPWASSDCSPCQS